MADAAPLAIRLAGIDKRFGPVHANKQVDLEVAPATVHGIIGENGAGKSTLMSILYGLYEADGGTIEIDGTPVALAASGDAIAAGIGMVHQHFMLVETMTVLENVVLGAEGGFLTAPGLAHARSALADIEERFGLELDPDVLVGDLPVGLKQRLEILKALYRGARILILDEPTGVLTPQEAMQLFRILDELKAGGVTILLITHKLKEVLAITDTVSVMRRGEMVAHLPTAEATAERLAELMVGRKVSLKVDKTEARPGESRLDVRALTLVDGAGVKRLDEVSFDVRAGEIVGIAGVSGNGQTELLECLAGIRHPTGGAVEIGGRLLENFAHGGGADPLQMRGLGLGHVPEDRQAMGLIAPFEARESAILGRHLEPRFNKGLWNDPKEMERHCRGLMEEYDVRPPNPFLKSFSFSGGNQQKIVMAREVDAAPKVLIVGQPTRGVDIGAIEFIHKQLIALRDSGAAILLVSVELDEIMALSDRIVVMCQGRVVGTLDAAGADERTLGLMMAGNTVEAAA